MVVTRVVATADTLVGIGPADCAIAVSRHGIVAPPLMRIDFDRLECGSAFTISADRERIAGGVELVSVPDEEVRSEPIVVTHISSWGLDPRGNLYAVSLDGVVFRVTG